jgi:hypothetical protein
MYAESLPKAKATNKCITPFPASEQASTKVTQETPPTLHRPCVQVLAVLEADHLEGLGLCHVGLLQAGNDT